VVGGKFVWRDLMQNKLGITTTEYSRGAHAGFDSMNRKWDQSELKWLETFLNKTYDQFKDRVRASRGERLKGNLDEMAGGRVFTGQQALEHGLIDRIGGLSDAISFAARKAYLGAEYEVYVFPRPSEFQQMLNLLQKLMGDDGKDEFEIGHEARLATDPLVRTALPLLRGLAPAQFRELVRGLRNLVILQHERVGCFMPFVPQVR
jgi:protease-4